MLIYHVPCTMWCLLSQYRDRDIVIETDGRFLNGLGSQIRYNLYDTSKALLDVGRTKIRWPLFIVGNWLKTTYRG